MLNPRSKEVRREAIALSKANGGYHYGGSFSPAEILIDLFDSSMTPEDEFVFSKGHGCWVFYALLREKGFKPVMEGHPHRDPHNGIAVTSGSMGHGLPTAVGMALGRKIKSRPGRIFVLVGDGECQEGTTWESILICGHLGLNNLVCIVDNNGIQGSARTSDILPVIEPLMAAADCAGWATVVVDGHDGSIKHALAEQGPLPLLVVANTVKGKGVSFMEDNPNWHSNWLTPDLESQALSELS